MFKKIECAKTDGTGRKPFLDVAFEKGLVVNGEALEIVEVKESASRGGYVIHTATCLVHVWKSSPMAEVLIEEMESLVAQNPSPKLYLVVDEQDSSGYYLAEDPENFTMWKKAKKFGNISHFTQTSPKSGVRGGKNSRG